MRESLAASMGEKKAGTSQLLASQRMALIICDHSNTLESSSSLGANVGSVDL
jgi:hypothetical protein